MNCSSTSVTKVSQQFAAALFIVDDSVEEDWELTAFDADVSAQLADEPACQVLDEGYR